MKVSNARDVMNLLLTSERVNVDMDDWLRSLSYSNVDDTFRYGEPEQIVLRQWEPELTIDNEFRAFVYRNKLNGISQYDHYGVFPHLPAIKDKVCWLIESRLTSEGSREDSSALGARTSSHWRGELLR